MKKLLFSLLLPIFFLCGTVFNSYAADQIRNGGVVLVVLNVKTGSACAFDIPEKYLDKNGQLICPLEINMTDQNKTTIFTTFTENLEVMLPKAYSGTYYVEVLIGDYYSSKKINL